jgi:hypothetical protein
VRGQDALATAGGTPALLSAALFFNEPGQEVVLEFVGRGADCAAVVGIWDLPQVCIWGSRVNALRVPQQDVAIDLAVNQEHRNRCIRDRIFWRNLFHVEVILQARAEEGDFNERSQECTSHPRP